MWCLRVVEERYSYSDTACRAKERQENGAWVISDGARIDWMGRRALTFFFLNLEVGVRSSEDEDLPTALGTGREREGRKRRGEQGEIIIKRTAGLDREGLGVCLGDRSAERR